MPILNDVHHVCKNNGNLLVVSTGLDRIIIFNKDGKFEAYHTFDEVIPIDLHKDYRHVNTKPHLSHPNFVDVINNEIWASRIGRF